MRAMVVRDPGPIEGDVLVAESLPDPEPGAGEILVRVLACGVCHTDLHVAEGDLPLRKRPVVLGHQVVGVVEALGPGAASVAVGERVGLPWLRRTCGACAQCRSGRENLCADAEFNGWHADGGYAERCVAPAGFVHRIPSSFDDASAAPLLCAGIVGFRALRLAEVPPRGRLGLYGFGASAHVVLQIALHRGHEVFVFSRSERHRQHARDLGAAWTGRAEDRAPAPLDSAIIFAPSGLLVPDALRALGPGGTLAIASITTTPIPEMDYDTLLYRERTVRSVANATRADAEGLLAEAAEAGIRPDVERYGLEDAPEVLRRLKRSQLRGAAVLVP